MFDNLSQQLSRTFLGAVVIVLALAFIISSPFGNQQGCQPPGETYAARVYGHTITKGDFDSSYTMAAFILNRRRSFQVPREAAERFDLREHVMNGLVERTLLADRARELGFVADEKLVWQDIHDSGVVLFSAGVDAPVQLPTTRVALPVFDEDGDFDREVAENIIQYQLRRSPGEFTENQIEERLAEKMRSTVLASVTISPQEIWDAYVQEKDRATITYLRLFPRYYRERLTPTEEEVRAWLAVEENQTAVQQEYEARQRDFTDLEKQVRARHILVRLEEGAPEDVAATARSRAEQILAKVRSGTEPFSELARRYSDDDGSARRGGDLDWNERGAMVEAFDEAQFSMDVGDVSGLVESRFGFHIIKVVGIREGTVPEEDAILEIATEKYRQARGTELAREAAERGLEMLREGTDPETIATALETYPSTAPAEEPELDPLAADRERDSFAPSAQESRSFGRGGVPVDGVDNGPLIRSVFEDLSMDSPLPEEVLELGGDFFVYELTEREFATEEDFDESVRRRLMNGLSQQKQREALALFVDGLRAEAQRNNSITVNDSVLSYNEGAEVVVDEDDDGADG